MDDEDLADAEEAKRLQTSDSFAGLGSTANDVVPESHITELLRDGGDTIGVKLLKKMGWREGQGIGAKIRRQAQLGDADDPGGTEPTYSFAPENTKPISFVRKDDHKGLGFKAESRLTGPATDTSLRRATTGVDPGANVGLDLFSAKTRIGSRRESNRGAFGVGVLNDNGSDDEDAYQMGPQISYNRVIGADKKKKKKSSDANVAIGSANPLLGSKPVFISKKATSLKSSGGFRRCHDGRLPLDGFVLSQDTGTLQAVASSVAKYLPPDVPHSWRSSKNPNLSRDTSSFVSTAEAARSHNLDPRARALLLGESVLPGKSVFDYLSSSARDRIASASGKTDLPIAKAEPAPTGFSLTDDEKKKEFWSLVPALDKDVAIKALGRGIGGWMPYAEDDSKRARYRAFLELRAGLRGELPERPAGMLKGDWLNELNEFAHAAQIFKPMTGMMATRFTTSTASPIVASDTPDTADARNILHKSSERPEDPAEAAAKVGMYGPMTRSLQQFFPTRLLCKRFNVQPPGHVQLDPEHRPDDFMGDATDGKSRFQSANSQMHSSASQLTKLELVSEETMNTMMIDSGRRLEAWKNTDLQGTEAALNGGAKEAVIDAERNEALESERPGDAVFKAIFGSDDDDDDDNE